MSRTVRFAVAILVATVFAAGCGAETKQPSSTLQKVVVALDWTPNTNHSGIYLAQRDGLYRDAGLEVQIVEPGQEGADGLVASGKAQFGFSYSEEVLPRRAEGTPIVSIAAVLQENTSSLISPTDRGIRRPRDLEGKRYAGYGGLIEKPLIEAMVRCDRGDPSKVEFVDVGNVDYAVGFRKNAYDVVWAFDGWDVIRLREIAKTSVTTIPVRDSDCVPTWYTPVLISSEANLAAEPDTAKRFLAATATGYEKAAKDPAAAAEALTQAVPESDRALVTSSARFLAPFYVDSYGTFGAQDEGVWSSFATFLRESMLPTPPAADVNMAFTNEFLPSR